MPDRQCFGVYSFSRPLFLFILMICTNIDWGVTGQLTFNNPMYKPTKVDKDSAGTGVDWIHSGDVSPPPSPPQSLGMNSNNFQPNQNVHQGNGGGPYNSNPQRGSGPHHNVNPQQGGGGSLHNPLKGNGPRHNPNPHYAVPNPQQANYMNQFGQPQKNVHEVVVEDSLKLRPSFEFNGGDKFAWDDKEFQRQKELSEKMQALGISKGNENPIYQGGGDIVTHIRREELSKGNHQSSHGATQHHGWNDPTLQERPLDYYKGKINHDPNTAFILENYDKKKLEQQLSEEEYQKSIKGKLRSHRFDDPPAEIQYKQKWMNDKDDDGDYESSGYSFHYKSATRLVMMLLMYVYIVFIAISM